jgi:hypothetical protein
MTTLFMAFWSQMAETKVKKQLNQGTSPSRLAHTHPGVHSTAPTKTEQPEKRW